MHKRWNCSECRSVKENAAENRLFAAECDDVGDTGINGEKLTQLCALRSGQGLSQNPRNHFRDRQRSVRSAAAPKRFQKRPEKQETLTIQSYDYKRNKKWLRLLRRYGG
jgi:hypothetical protein